MPQQDTITITINGITITMPRSSTETVQYVITVPPPTNEVNGPSETDSPQTTTTATVIPFPREAVKDNFTNSTSNVESGGQLPVEPDSTTGDSDNPDNSTPALLGPPELPTDAGQFIGVIRVNHGPEIAELALDFFNRPKQNPSVTLAILKLIAYPERSVSGIAEELGLDLSQLISARARYRAHRKYSNFGKLIPSIKTVDQSELATPDVDDSLAALSDLFEGLPLGGELIETIRTKYGDEVADDAAEYFNRPKANSQTNAQSKILRSAALFYVAHNPEYTQIKVAEMYRLDSKQLYQIMYYLKNDEKFPRLASLIVRKMPDSIQHDPEPDELNDESRELIATAYAGQTSEATANQLPIETISSTSVSIDSIIEGLRASRIACTVAEKADATTFFCEMLKKENHASPEAREKYRADMLQAKVSGPSIRMFDKLLELFDYFVEYRPFGNSLLINDINNAFRVSDEDALIIIKAIGKQKP